MSRVDDLSEKFDLNNWPHQFTKTHTEKQIGKDEMTGDPIIAVEMTCVHCMARYVAGIAARPLDPCPARSKKSEMKRILN